MDADGWFGRADFRREIRRNKIRPRLVVHAGRVVPLVRQSAAANLLPFDFGGDFTTAWLPEPLPLLAIAFCFGASGLTGLTIAGPGRF